MDWTVGPLLAGFPCLTSHGLDRWATFGRVSVPNVPWTGPLDHFCLGFAAQRPTHWTVGPLSAEFPCLTSHGLDRWATFGWVSVPNVPWTGPLDHFRPSFRTQRPTLLTVKLGPVGVRLHRIQGRLLWPSDGYLRRICI